MSNSNFNIRIDDNLRAEATKILAGYGLSPSLAIKLFLNQVVATRKVPLSFDYQAEEIEKVPSDKLLQAIEEAEQGETTTYNNLDDFLQAFSHEKN